MSKKAKILGGTLVVLALVVAGVVGMAATASAEEPTPTSQATATTPQADLLARVAQILGIDQQKVTDAFAQAASELRTQALQDHIQKLVEEGKITQNEADQYLQWWQQRPEVLNKGLVPGLGGGGFGGGRMRGGCFGW